MKKLAFLLATTMCLNTAFAAQPTVQKDSVVIVKTEFGDIILRLYNETPKHRDNFMKLVRNHFYDSLLFHRVIKDFMIQGGDPQSKRATPEASLGNGENGYTIPPEFNPAFIHKKGALAAARMGDNINPQKNSSGCQFYIVQGRKFTEADLSNSEGNINNQTKQQLFQSYISNPANEKTKNTLVRLQTNKNQDSLKILSEGFNKIVEDAFAKTIPFKYTPEQKTIYTTIGGTPHLDMGYTVFGEVVSGLEIIDKIGEVEKGAADRPKKDVRMVIMPYTEPKVKK